MKQVKSGQQKFMRLALKLAQKAQGFTNPNPLVGAVVVKSGRVIGRGYHKRAGCAHAEIIALRQAGSRACGAALYLTLEPCCHFGRTAPCVDKIIASNIKEVVLAMRDPNPLNNGRGIRLLRRQGIKVVTGVLENEARQLNRVFIKYITQGLPFVSVKVAQSLDGKIATKTGDSRWISSVVSRKFAHQLREQVDAILVGINTILWDDPLLSCRKNAGLRQRQPKKVIVDSRLRTPFGARIFSSPSPAPVIIATTRFAPRKKLLSWRKKGIQVIIAKDIKGRVNLRNLFQQLAQQELSHILIEGGGEVIASALKQNLVDKMYVIISPKIIGGREAPTSIGGEGIKRMKQASELKDIVLRKLGPDLLIEGKPHGTSRNLPEL